MTHSSRKPRKPAPVPLIPGYRLESVIGRGATGVVYRARQLAVDREIALKVIHPELTGKQRTIARLQREARTTARLAHPHIVAAIDMGEVDGRWWYAMELVDGPSLALKLRQEGRLGEREALRLFIPLCEALVHMSEHGVVHRDIKPGNILIDRAGGARLADLGLAFAGDDPLLTTQEGTLGTPHYISPEQARDPVSADVRSDIWSLGATFFHVLCGRPPFSGESSAEVLSGVLYAVIPDPHRLEPELSRGLGLVLRKCLSRSPAHRYQTPAELLNDLERVRERRRPRVRLGSLDPVESRYPSWVPWVGGGLALALLALGTWALTTRPWLTDEAPTPWPQLEQQRELLSRGSGYYADVLAGLRELRPPPATHVHAYHELVFQVDQALRGELDTITAQTDRAIDSLLEERDYSRAIETLGIDMDSLLRERTGYSLERPPKEDTGFARWLEVKERDVERALNAAKRRLSGQLEDRLTQVLLPEVGRAVEAQRWRSADELLALDLEALAAGTGLDLRGFPPEDLDEVLGRIEERLSNEREMLYARWREVADDLRSWIAERGRGLEQQLAARELREGAASRLEGAYRGHLLERDILREEMLRGPLSVEDEFQRWVDRLDRIEQELRREEAAKGFDVLDSVTAWLDEALCREAFARRDYAGVGDVWELQRRRLASLPQVADNQPWRLRLEAIVGWRLEEAERLDGLLDRAARGILDRDGREATIYVGSVGRRGTIEAGSDPKHLVFFLVRAVEETVGAQGAGLGEGAGALGPERAVEQAEEERLALHLADLQPATVEMLAGLEVDPEAMVEPRDRLLRALFRMREGEPDRAADILESGDLPTGALDEQLIKDLYWRIGVARADAAREPDQREREVEELFAGLREDRTADRGRAALRKIDKLLEDFADVPRVVENLELLHSWRELYATETPSDPEGRLELHYRPLELEFLEDERVRLAWDFGIKSDGWQTGDWTRNGAGRSPLDGVRQLSDLLDQRALRLLLPPPLKLDSGELVVTLDILPAEGQARIAVFSVAGFHLALVGDRLPGGAGFGWQAGRETPAELVARVAAGEVEAVQSEFFPADRPTRLRIAVSRSRGELRVELGEADAPLSELCRRTFPASRSGEPMGSRSVAILAWEPITITGVELVGSYGAH